MIDFQKKLINNTKLNIIRFPQQLLFIKPVIIQQELSSSFINSTVDADR